MPAGCSLNCHHHYSGHPDKPPAPHREAGFHTWWHEGEGQKFEGFLLQVATQSFPARVCRAVRAAAWSETLWQGVAKLHAQWVQLDRELPGKTPADFIYLFLMDDPKCLVLPCSKCHLLFFSFKWHFYILLHLLYRNLKKSWKLLFLSYLQAFSSVYIHL